MKRIIIFIYGIVGYLSFVIATLYAIGFLNNAVVPTGIEKGVVRPFPVALAIDVGLIALFGLAHSIMPLAFLLTAYRFLVHAIRKAVGVGDDDDVGAVV